MFCSCKRSMMVVQLSCIYASLGMWWVLDERFRGKLHWERTKHQSSALVATRVMLIPVSSRHEAPSQNKRHRYIALVVGIVLNEHRHRSKWSMGGEWLGMTQRSHGQGSVTVHQSAPLHWSMIDYIYTMYLYIFIWKRYRRCSAWSWLLDKNSMCGQESKPPKITSQRFQTFSILTRPTRAPIGNGE